MANVSFLAEQANVNIMHKDGVIQGNSQSYGPRAGAFHKTTRLAMQGFLFGVKISFQKITND